MTKDEAMKLAMEALKSTSNALSWLRDLKQPTEEHLKRFADDGDTRVSKALTALSDAMGDNQSGKGASGGVSYTASPGGGGGGGAGVPVYPHIVWREDEMTNVSEAMGDDWLPIESAPDGIEVLTKIDDHNGVRNETTLIRRGNLWWMPDGSMYVYYKPTHWMPKPLPPQKKEGA